MAKILNEFPDFEDATWAWSRVAILFTQEKHGDFEYVNLQGKNCYAKDVWEALKDPEIRGISGLSVGHGKSCVTTVQDYDEDFRCGAQQNILLRGRYFNKASCLEDDLVEDLVQHFGLSCGCGEKTEYWIVTNKASDPRQDPIWFFIDANFEFDRALIFQSSLH